MAYADAVKFRVTVDDDRRAYHMLIRSGLTDDQINHVYGLVFDSDAPEKVIGMNESPLPADIKIAQGNLIANVAKSWDEIHRNVNYLIHDNWVAYFRT